MFSMDILTSEGLSVKYRQPPNTIYDVIEVGWNCKQEIDVSEEMKKCYPEYSENETKDADIVANLLHEEIHIKPDPDAVISNTNDLQKQNSNTPLFGIVRTENMEAIITVDSVAKLVYCPNCEYNTKNKGDMVKHMNVKHMPHVTWHNCHRCDYRTKHLIYLRRHFRQIHDEKIKWHHCQVCGYKTKSLRNLQRHFAVKHDEEADWYMCQVCNFSTKHKEYLRQHYKLKHDEGAEQHQCQICPFKTKLVSSLRRHFRLRHGKGVK